MTQKAAICFLQITIVKKENQLKFGRSIERLDLYTRLDYPVELLRKEFSIMLNRLYKVGIDFNSHSIERLSRMILEEDDYTCLWIS